MKCFKCGNNLPDDSKFCQYCGTDLSQGCYCSNCGVVVQEEMNFCPKCGNRLHGVQDEESTLQVAPMEIERQAIKMVPVEEGFGDIPTVDDTHEPKNIPVQEEGSSVAVAVETETEPESHGEQKASAKKKKLWIPLVVSGIVFAAIIVVFASGGRKNQTLIPVQASENVLYLEIYDSEDACIGTGSGFLINDGLTLVTNYHVIEEACSMIAMTADSEHIVEVDTVLAYDENADLAILKCSEKIGVEPLTLADSDQVKQGDTVYAAGYPLGIANTLSNGIVSSRYIDEYGVDLLQITAPVSEGSSGGALLNESGQVIGVVCAYYIDGQNMNLAIAANTIDRVLKENEHTQSLLDLYLEKHPPTKPEELQPIMPVPAPDKEPEETKPSEESKPPEEAKLSEESKPPEELPPPVCSHAYGEWKIKKEATCTQNGTKVRECALCGESQEKVIEPKGHVEVEDVEVAATCISEGKTDGVHCSACGEVLVTQSATPITEHIYLNGYCTSCGGIDPNYLWITAADLQGTWKETWTNKEYLGYRSYTFSGSSYRWEQRAAGEDSVLQVQTGAYFVDGMNVYFIPDSYTEDGVAIDYLIDPDSRKIMEFSKNKLVLFPGFNLFKQ